MHADQPIPSRRHLALAVLILAVQAGALLAMGRSAICTCGTVRLWVGSVTSPELSQQIFDWYTFSHVIHGFLLYGLTWLIAPQAPIGLRFAAAIGLEACWEIVENTPFIIDRYRQSALAQGYVGDSVLNSLSDTFSAVTGFWLARSVPTFAIVVIALVLELGTATAIHDNLTLNLIQLVHPSEAISRWQAGG